MRFSLAPALLAAALHFTASSITFASAKSCVAFDSSFNLYAFGLSDGSDYSLGTQDSWKNGQAKKLTTSGRPPFDGNNTQCFLAQYFNAIYVIDADQANPGNVHIFSADSQSWSTQQTNLNGVDPSSLVAILDHDTNVFFAMSGGKLYQADFMQLNKAQGSAIDWQGVGTPSFKTDGYQPVMAIAQNHIHFLNVPGAAAGQAYIFVIHFSYFQPDAQAYPASSGSSFPDSHGQAQSFFDSNSNNVQQQFAFIPDSGANTYIVNVENNSTTTVAGPSSKDSSGVYAAGASALVQLTSSGALSYLSFTPNNPSASNSWSAISASGLPAASSGSASATGTATGASSNSRIVASRTSSSVSGGTNTASGGTTPPSSSPTGGALATMKANPLAGYALGAVALFFTLAL